MNRNKLYAIATVIITVVLAISVYSLDFNVSNNKDSLTASAKAYIHQFDEGKQFEPKFITSLNLGKRMLAIFNDDTYDDFMLAVIFQRGITGFWRPIKASYEAGPVIQSITTNNNPSKTDISYMAYYAVNCPPEVKSYQIIGTIYSNEKKAYVPDTVIDQKITKSTFIHLYRQVGFAELRLYDEHGIELPKKTYLQINQNYPNSAIGTAELGTVNVISIIILAIGGIIARSFLIPRKRNDIS